ncbi:MAG: flagellin, partial [Alphaproteobacteria bacterium]|nr:flagellin [Alphaproteobacteria bacterium]
LTNIAFGDTTEIGSAADAASAVDAIATSIGNVNNVLSKLGSASRQIDAQVTFTSKLSDVISSGVGTLVDADMAKESAALQALQVKQQLGVQALSIANQAPQSIMSLFR